MHMARVTSRVPFVLLIFFINPLTGVAIVQESEPGKKFPAKGCNVLSVAFSHDPRASTISLEWSRDGKTFFPAEVGLPRPWQLLRTIKANEDNAVFWAPVVAGFGPGGQFVFAERGRYWLRWTAESADAQTESQTVVQELQVTPATQPDLAFLETISDPAFLRHVFGEDFFDRQADGVRQRMLDASGADLCALGVIEVLLTSTLEAKPADVVRRLEGGENVLARADAFWNLAQRFPESSYAPYAADYAGCCYAASIMASCRQARKQQADKGRKEADIRVIQAEAARANPNFPAAEAALSFAVNSADEYLKPRALVHSARLRYWSGERIEMERLLGEALHSAPGDPTIARWVEVGRRSVADAPAPPNGP